VEYVFDPDTVHECAMTGLDLPKPAMFDAIAEALDAKYPGRIDVSQPWIYSIAGGAMIQMKLYHASIFEYVMIWGTPIGSEGHSGRHAVGFWDTVIDGEMWYYGEGQFEKRVYKPGDRVYVGPGQARAMNFTDGVWAVEYARGPLPLSIPFGIADELLSTLDFATAGQTLAIYMSLVGQNWLAPLPDGSESPMLRRALGGVLGTVGPVLTRLLRPAEPTDEIPSDRR
jgi:C-8 sterol isomerase